MRTRLKIALSAITILFSLVGLSQFLLWMNRASDAWLYAGALGVLSLLVAVPGVVRAIWRSDFFNPKRP
ncbi:MAG TPA: hypothetical protein VH437_10725 [Terriglobales bacterium]|jgi:hypothetical protein